MKIPEVRSAPESDPTVQGAHHSESPAQADRPSEASEAALLGAASESSDEATILAAIRSAQQDSGDDIGSAAALPRPDIDVILHPSRSRPIAGELWSVAGEIHNRSKITIWIVDRTTVLTLAPEMWGQTSQRGSIGAFFPTTRRVSDEVVRIDPGAKYIVIWKLDTLDTKNDANTVRQVFRRIWCALRDFTFFNPGTFTISSTVHVWSAPPKTDDIGKVNNVGSSYTVSVSRDVEMEASPWVLILGAALGGVLCFVIQILFGRIILLGPWASMLKTVAVGLGTATLLCGVATVLISRLAKADFIVVVKVTDIWGAITTGFVVQWFGYDALVKLIPVVGHGAQ